MRAIVQHGPGDLRLEERPTPAPDSGEVLVRVLASGICGSDLHFFKQGLPPGAVLGHELSGTIAALGDGVEGLQVGAVGAIHAGIACGECHRCRAGLTYYCKGERGLGTGGPQGGLAEYVVVPAENFLAAPGGWDPAALTLTEPLANGLRCAAFPEAGKAAFTVVIGGGPLGLSCLVGVRQAGAGRVWVVEGRARRRDAALALGAERVLHPEQDDVKAELRAACPQGADLVVEAVGLETTIQSSFLIVRPRGHVVVMGVTPGAIRVNPGVWLVKELTIRSSIGCDLKDHRAALDLVTSGRVDAAALVTRRIGLEEVPGMLAELAAGADEVKVVAEHRSAASSA